VSQRLERVAGEIRAVLGEILAREEIKDPRVRGAGLITVTNVRVSGDLGHAKVGFTVYGLDEAGMERVRAGLEHASGYFRQAVSRRLRTKVSPAITFEVDRAFDQATKLESLLREIGSQTAAATTAAGNEDGDEDEDEDEDEDGKK
jgi:ribosome-binding factor A